MTPVHRPVQKGDHIFLVDASNFVFRAYFQSIRQDPKYNYRSDKLPTGALRLFCTKLFQFIEKGAAGVRPTHLAIIFDKSEKSFRKELYPPYKANRSEPPEDLIPQFPLMREATRAFGLIPLEQDRFEADDLIATYARQARDRGADVLIISADKDLMQLIEPGVAMFDPASGVAGSAGAREERRIGEAEVIDYFGVPPNKVVDVQALAGDSTDNVPGAPGIGVKTAAQLINEYGDLDSLLARAGEIKQPKRRETLTNPDIVEQVRVSKKLVELVRDVELECPLDDLGLVPPDGKTLVAFMKALEFTTITRRAGEIFGVDPNEIEANPSLVGPGGWRARNGDLQERPTQSEAPEIEVSVADSASAPVASAEGEGSPQALARHRAAHALGEKIDRSAYETITSIEALDRWIAAAYDFGVVCIDTETSSLDPFEADLVGVSLAIAPGRACYIPIGHLKEGATGDLFGEGGLAEGQLRREIVLARLKPLLEDRSVLKIAQNMKYDLEVLREAGIDVVNIDDTMLMSYVLDAGRNGHGMDELSQKHLGHSPIQFGQVAGTGKSFIGFARVAIDKAADYSAEDSDVTLRLWRVLKPRLAAEGVGAVYETLERPLIDVLARMERRGISIDRQILSRLSGEFAQGMARLEADIQGIVGEPFNPGSPKQLGDILFGKMGLPGGKKTASGAWSTTASVLEELAEQGHDLPARILEWRSLQKLKSTYTDALPGYVNARTQRVHTSYSLAATTTGRLSSSEPNLQNIPVRNEAGRKIRTAFIAAPGHQLISADYSQIELRVLAHMADIPQLKKAFAEGLDIHAMTASEMFGVPVKDMPSDVRRRAMTRMDAALVDAKLDAQMLLQVHDELVFEVPQSQVEATIALARQVMVDAPNPAVRLSVPLQVDAKAAKNWDEAH